MEMKPLQLLLLLQLFLLAQASSSNELDRFALRHLRYSLQIRNFYWPKSADDPCSSWRGIQCEQDRVVGIHLSGLKRTAAGMSRPSFQVDSLRQLPLLRYFNASGFLLEGSIPSWFGEELPQLKILDLSSCSGIQGSIPDSLGELRNLEFLSLAKNNLSGGLPYSIGSLASLRSLNLSSNFLGGRLPFSLTTMGSLVTLDLSNNAFDGLPAINEEVSRIEQLVLAGNRFNGSLTQLKLESLGNLTSLELSRNNFWGAIPETLSSCVRLQRLDLSRNALNGTISAALGSLKNLRFLDLSRNNLSGFLPAELAALDKIERIDLSDNQLYGAVPAGFAKPKSLIFFDLSFDYFNGTVPAEVAKAAVLNGNCLEDVARQRYVKDCQLFYTSRGLAFAGVVGMLPTATPLVGIEKSGGIGKTKRHVGAILGGILGSLGFINVVILVVYTCQRRERRSRSSRKSDKVSGSQTGGSMRQEEAVTNVTVNLSCIGEAFTFTQLQRATHDFNPVNLIRAGHTGDLFRGVLDGGLLVVVKRVDVTSVKKDFLLSELELFSKASHTRLVPLLGHCLERETEKFLVYKYMQYGDLAQALHRKIIPSPPKDVLQSLDWITRLKIAIGAAEGLTYLHHECSPALVHRDIKATSILLDDKYEVRLGSLSDARIQDGGLHPNLIMRFLRRSQNSEQDPDSPVASCAYDVYCFGKVLLELVSGKLGISGTMDPGADTYVESMLPLIDRHEKENLSKLVDPSLLVDDDLLEEVWAVAIVAKMCLNPKPSRRPAIRHILKALENPQRVVRDENFTASLRRSSHSSWNGSLFGSWRHSSSETVIPATLKEEDHHSQEGSTSHNIINNRKPSSSSMLQDNGHHHRRHGSNEIFPEPFEGLEQQQQQQQQRQQ